MNIPKKTVHLCFCAQLSISHVQKIDKTAALPHFKAFFSGIHALEKLPITLYAAGSFLEWQKGRRQGYAMLINEMLAHKQIDLLSGGYYQPYLSMLPVSDVIGQIELMNTAIRTHFDKRPRGVFLTGSAWAPYLITPLTKCGMDYCLLDRRLFTSIPDSAATKAGSSTVVLEDNGKTITAFPYTWGDTGIMDNTPEAFYEKITANASSEEETIHLLFLPVNTYVKGLEKNKEGQSWFSSFVELCSQPHSVIKLTHTASLIKRKRHPAPVYIPPNTVLADTATAASAKQIITMDRFAFQLYAKMMYVHVLANGVKGDKSRKKYALQEFWKAQTAEFFTLDKRYFPYRNSLRRLAYRNLLVAEKQTRLQGVFADGIIRYDIDLDGLKEFLSQRSLLNLYVHHCGAKIFECDIFSAYKNYSDILTENSGMFVDYLLPERDLAVLKTGSTVSLPEVFSQNIYQEVDCNTIRSELKFATEGYFDTIRQPVSLRKQYTFFNEGTQVQYILKNDSPFNLSAYFTVGLTIALENSSGIQPSFSVYDDIRKKEYTLSTETFTFSDISLLQLNDPEGKVQFTMEANEVPHLIVIPIHEQNAQSGTATRGVRLFFYWKTDLNPGYETEKMLFLKIKSQKPV